jgi:hypothetical protein
MTFQPSWPTAATRPASRRAAGASSAPARFCPSQKAAPITSTVRFARTLPAEGFSIVRQGFDRLGRVSAKLE